MMTTTATPYLFRMDHLSAMRLLDDCRARGGVVRR